MPRAVSQRCSSWTATSSSSLTRRRLRSAAGAATLGSAACATGTSDSSSTCTSGPFRPLATLSSCQALMLLRSSRALKPAAGCSSIATPV